MPYVYKPRRQTSRSLGAGNYSAPSIGGTARGSGAGMTGLIGSAGGQVSTSRDTGRGAPERLEADVMGFVQTAAMGPGHTLERPLSVANTAAKFLMGTPQEKAGPLDGILKGIGDIGIGDATIGNALGAVGKGVIQVGDAPIAVLNSKDARTLVKYRNAPDSQVMDEFFDYKTDGPPILGLFGIGGRNMTVGEFKENLAKRGWNQSYDEETGEVTELPWEQVMEKASTDALGFGDKALNDSIFVDMAARIGLDPFNLLMGAGVLSKGVRIASWASRSPLGQVSRAAGSRLTPAFGVGYSRDMARAGIRAAQKPAGMASAEAIAAGQMQSATLRGLGHVLAAPRKLLLPGTGSLPRRYARGALRMELGLLAAEGATSLVDQGATSVLGEDNVVSGFMEPIHDAAQTFLAGKPMSQDVTFMLVSAFALPVVPLLKEDIGAARGAARQTFGDQDLFLWGREYGADATGLGRLADPMGRRRGKAKEAELLTRLGGKQEFARLIDHIDMRIAFDRIKQYSPLVKHFESFDEAMARSRAIGHLVATEAARLRDAGQMKPELRLESFRNWGRAHSRTVVDRKGNLLPEVPQRVDFEVSPNELIDQWIRYRDVHAQLAERFQPVGEAILGRANRLTKEDLQIVQGQIAGAAKNGRVSAAYVRDLLSQTPAMFEDTLLSPEQREYWLRLMNLGVGAVDNGQYYRGRVAGKNATLDLAELDSHLTSLHKLAPEGRELYHEAARSERKAPADPSLAGAGVVRRGKLRRIYSAKALRDLRVNANGEVRSLTKRIESARAAMDRKWTKKGNLRATGPRVVRATKPEVSPNGGIDELRSVAQNYTAGYRGGVAPRVMKGRQPDSIDRLQGTGVMPDLQELSQYAVQGDHVYHLTPATRLDSIRESGLRPGRARPDEVMGVYFGGDAIDLHGLVPQANAGDGVLLRIRRDAADLEVTDIYGGKFEGELVSRKAVAPEALEYLGTDGQWHSLQEQTRLPRLKEGEYWPADSDFGRRTGLAYESLRSVDEAARPAYDAFVSETRAQWDALTEAGYKMEPWTKEGQPYATSAEMQADVRANKHLYFFTGGEPHPFMGTPIADLGGLTANDIFRAVHDIMTHAQEGFQFGARGELNAAIKHAQMFSPLARRAMLTETHGQNSWTNHGPHEPGRMAAPDRPYADQKAALLPDEIIDEFEHRFLGEPLTEASKAASAAERKAQKAAWDLERRAEADEISEMVEQARGLRREVREINRRADELRTTRIDPSFLDENGNPTVSPESLQTLREQTAYVQDTFPAQYHVEKAPKVSYARYQPEDSHLAALLTERSNLAQVLFDYGPIAKTTQFLSWITAPVKSSKMAHDGRQMVYNHTLPLGAKAEEVTDFLTRLADQRNQGYTIGKLQNPFFRGITALPPGVISKMARDAFGNNKGFIDAFEKKYGGMDRMHVMLDEAHNSLIRRIDTQVMRGQANWKDRPLSRIFRSGYWAWQNVPGLKGLSDSTRMVSKIFYPLFRFSMDARWQTLNIIEADTIAFFRDGVDGTRFSRGRDHIARRGGRDVNLTQNAVDFHGELSGMPRAGQKGKGTEGAYEDTGIFLTNQNLAPVLRRSFQKALPENVDAVLNDYAATDPILQLLQRKYGMEKGTWARQLNETLYSFDRRGVRNSVDEAVRHVRKYEKWSQAEYDQMIPFINKLVERNQQTFNDLTALHVGNINRSHLERTMNSFWLYWPLSYQIKATKWMVGVLTDQAFGQQTNLGGAFTLERAADRVRELSRNPEFQQQMEDNEDWWFLASMLLPIAPWDAGLSLNRHVRYVGGNILGLWDEYAGLNDVGDYAGKTLEMGPIYTLDLFDRFTTQKAEPSQSGPTPTSLVP